MRDIKRLFEVIFMLFKEVFAAFFPEEDEEENAKEQNDAEEVNEENDNKEE